MAFLTGRAASLGGDTTKVDTVLQQQLGTRAFDTAGNEYIYLQGVASLDATHNWVTFDEDGVTTLIAANAVGRVAVAMAIIDATTKYGWFQIYGKNSAGGSDAIAIDKQMFIDATAGRVDDAAVSGDGVYGVWSRSTDASTNIATFELCYPFVTDTSFA